MTKLQEGDVIGQLTFVKRSHIQDNKHCYSIFRCECGTEFSARNDSVRLGRIQSCGCKTTAFRSAKTTKYKVPVEYTESGVRKMPEFKEDDYKRFWEKVNVQANIDVCWDWTAANNGRYGHFAIGKKSFKSNRIAYFLYHKEDPLGADIRHSCHRPICCNPHHLSTGTKSDNMKDMVESGRWRTGIHEKKLTREEVLEIKDLSNAGIATVELSKKFKVHPSTILKAVKRNINS